MKNYCIIFLLTMLTFSLSASAAKEPKMQSIYIFGFAASFTDSIACQTAVQRVDSAWLDRHGFLVDRSLYSLQLQLYMEQEEKLPNDVCTVFFSTKKRSAEKLWAKIQRKYEAAQNLIYHVTPLDKFSFKAEEYKPIVEYDPSDVEEASANASKPDGKKDSKSKKTSKSKKKEKKK